MKNLITISLTALVLSCGVKKDVDRSVVPQAGPAPTIQIGKPQSFTLDNGLKCFLVENHKLPKVSFSLSFERGPIMEGDQAGYLEIMGTLLGQGTTKRSKDQINEEVDFIGATLSTYSKGAYASSLSKHKEKVVEILADVILHPTFPQEELDKLITQSKSGIASSATDPSAISSNVGSKLIYGNMHPYGEITTEATIENIKREYIVSYYDKFFKPNAAHMVIVGDITLEEAKKLMNDNFTRWEKFPISTKKIQTPVAPEKTRVAFVDKPGAVQSLISISYPLDLKPSSPDVIKARVLNEILGGGGFSARLMQNIREDKAYTYGAYSTLSSDKEVGSFRAQASVRNEVTDSAIVEFLYEMNRIVNEKVTADELSLIKNKLNGSFARSLENPRTVARFALNIEKYNLAPDYYETYLQKLNAITVEDIQAMAKKYIRPENAVILVVGNKAEVAGKLGKFAANGKVEFYDNEGNPAISLEPAPEGMTAQTVIDNHLKAIGGREKLSTIKVLHSISSMNITGAPMEMEMVNVQVESEKTEDRKLLTTVSGMGQVFMTTKFDGKTGTDAGMMGNKTYEGKELEELINRTFIFGKLHFAKMGKISTLLGQEGNFYKLEIKDATGDVTYEYYNVKTGLLEKSIGTQDETTVETIVSDYMEVDGIKYAKTMKQVAGPQTIKITLKEVKTNSNVNVADFFK